MELRFTLSGSTLFSTETECIPQLGSVVHVVTSGYKKGLFAGSLISVKVTPENPPVYNYSEGGEPVVYIDLDGYEVIKEGPPPEDE